MDTAESSFRTAVFGGFNRQDVLNYIEMSAKTAAERTAALEKEVEAVTQERAAAAAEAERAKEQAAALEREVERLGKLLTERTAALEQTEVALVSESAASSAAREELGAIKGRISALESGANAYAELKDRTATIELEAHQRARAIENDALEKAKKVRTAAEQILYKVQAGYGRLRNDVDATIAHASGELGRVDKALESVQAEFAEHDAELERLLHSYRESAGCKAPEPLPLEEK